MTDKEEIKLYKNIIKEYKNIIDTKDIIIKDLITPKYEIKGLPNNTFR